MEAWDNHEGSLKVKSLDCLGEPEPCGTGQGELHTACEASPRERGALQSARLEERAV